MKGGNKSWFYPIDETENELYSRHQKKEMSKFFSLDEINPKETFFIPKKMLG